jgi:phosphomannomutase
MDRSWVHIRKSNTEPVVRIIAEACTEEEAADIVSRAESILKD